MKPKNFFSILLCMAVIFTITGCNTHSNKKAEVFVPSSADSSSLQRGSVDSKTTSTEADSRMQSQSSDVNIDDGASAQEAVLKQINASLHTKVPVMLPKSIPVEKDSYLTATTDSQAADYKVNFYGSNQPVKINSPEVSKGTLIASLEGTNYKDDANAKESISDYKQINTAEYDEFTALGHNIKAVRQAGTGHQQLLWNEGRWYIELDYPSDSAFQNKDYPDSLQLAKNIVAYLDKNSLPVPKNIAAIRIVNWNTSAGTTIQWQDNETVYQIKSQNPITALKVAVIMKTVNSK